MPTHIESLLLCHPAGIDANVRRIQVSAEWNDGGALALRYRIEGNSEAILLPGRQTPTAADGLWQHTCCEAFIAAVDDKKYREFNFSPSGQWANYRFIDYRQPDATFTPSTPPQITLHRRNDGFELNALLAKNQLPSNTTLNIGLAVVIENTDGSKNYWALQHCAKQPDFHLRQSFALTLHTTPP